MTCRLVLSGEVSGVEGVGCGCSGFMGVFHVEFYGEGCEVAFECTKLTYLY